jgi:putative flippase GtrA
MYFLIGYGKMDIGKLYIATNFIGIIAATLVNFLGSKFLAFSPGRLAFEVGSRGAGPSRGT